MTIEEAAKDKQVVDFIAIQTSQDTGRNALENITTVLFVSKRGNEEIFFFKKKKKVRAGNKTPVIPRTSAIRLYKLRAIITRRSLKNGPPLCLQILSILGIFPNL